jgi:hypothetical protein
MAQRSSALATEMSLYLRCGRFPSILGPSLAKRRMLPAGNKKAGECQPASAALLRKNIHH